MFYQLLNVVNYIKYQIGALLLQMMMMMMKWARILLSSIAWVVCSCGPRFCGAQGNSSPSSNPCETSEKCGAYGVCSPWGSPICTCLPGFEPRNNLEWGSQNWSGGCERRLPLRCEGDNGTTDDGFVKLQATMISLTDRWRWIAKLRGKRKNIELANAGVVEDVLSQVNIEELPLFTFETLAIATNNFSLANRLGKGGFGPVYKGHLANGRVIAVKRLSSASGQGMQEFMNEVVLISKLQHRNLVRLLGCSVDNKERMLIYECMPNKSLDFFLFDSSQEILDWRKRFKITEDICRGLLYLHRDSRLKIIHRDLKPSNILLDNDWNAKISDFGMARVFGTTQDHANTVRVVGTYGYMAPEYAIEGRFSEKTDVFSFGVVMLEIATGRKNTGFYLQEGSLNLLGHVWNLWKEGKVGSLIDKRISRAWEWEAEVMRCMHIGLLCVQELPKDRPSTSAVLSMLISETIELPEPNKPAFAIKGSSSTPNPPHTTTTSSRPSQKSSSSINNVTLTVVDGR